ncbi:T9SS type A sorting domain-containing protein [Aequorivita marina]|uniref:T9SS type A sorting domain-containing protein n=1 Tax=Aequorivita marina TaxID=3073654 RepID=UPI0028761FA6|nr:T9SS type A sorting domain-containing protein [Aequorivita sp. S2608]MDS1297523.1 T9SS type A sorting domain-containing protein [Aequorivita sp. S2608]
MKKQLLFSAFLLIATGAVAQLTVKPNGATDSYVYVKDEVLYVKGAIDLKKNNPGDEEASIYLREDGQLIQGGTDSNNSGNGYLSVQQNTDPTNAYAYYYWASPVGNPVAVGDIGGTALAAGNTNFGLESIYEDQNTTPGIGTKARISISIPGRNGFSDPLTISRRWMYIHEEPGTEAEGNYHRINASNGAPPGFGFTMKGVNQGTDAGLPGTGTNHDQLYEFRGRPNSGDFDIPVQEPANVPGGNPTTQPRMTLTGNPYPSALDLNKVFFESGNDALGQIYYYDENRDIMSHYYSQKPFGYGTWVPETEDPYTGGVPDPLAFPGDYAAATFNIWNAAGNQGPGGTGSPNTDNYKRFAPIGQGFMFVGKSGVINQTNVTIKNTHRYYMPEGAANQSVFQRAPSGNEGNKGSATSDTNPNEIITYTPPVDTRTPKLRLYTIFDNALTRDMLLILSDETSDGYDRGYDGLSPGGMKSDVFFPISNAEGDKLPYVIQGTNYNEEKQIPLTLKLHQASHVEVRAVEEINAPYERVYLFDNQENTYTRLHKGSISAGMNLPAGLYEDRFFIVFHNPNLRSDILDHELLAMEAVQKNVNFFQNNPGKQLEIRNPQNFNLKSAEVYDMSGKLIINDRNLGDDTKYTFYTGNLSDGVYVVKLTTQDNIVVDYKAIVHNK